MEYHAAMKKDKLNLRVTLMECPNAQRSGKGELQNHGYSIFFL
jgi:hypothetical protein